MEPIQSNEFHNDPQTLIPNQQEDSIMEDANDSLFDSMLVDSSSKLIQNGFTRSQNSEECVMFVNARGEATNEGADGVKFLSDTFFDGGNVFRTNEAIVEGGDISVSSGGKF